MKTVRCVFTVKTDVISWYLNLHIFSRNCILGRAYRRIAHATMHSIVMKMNVAVLLFVRGQSNQRLCGPATVRMDVEEQPRCVVITFIDRGRPYDPLSAEFTDTTHLPAKQRPIGGLGLYMVKKTMDEVSYEHVDGRNILRITKNI